MVSSLLYVLAAKMSIWTRLAVSGIAVVVGIILIVTGRANIRTQSAEETGKRQLVLKATGKSTEHKGQMAVSIGIARIVMGILAILFAIVFLIFGPFLAR
jgi:hypothetical protein